MKKPSELFGTWENGSPIEILDLLDKHHARLVDLEHARTGSVSEMARKEDEPEFFEFTDRDGDKARVRIVGDSWDFSYICMISGKWQPWDVDTDTWCYFLTPEARAWIDARLKPARPAPLVWRKAPDICQEAGIYWVRSGGGAGVYDRWAVGDKMVWDECAGPVDIPEPVELEGGEG